MSETVQIDTDPVNLHLLFRLELQRTLIVFLVDRDKNIRLSGHHLFNRIIEHPVQAGRPLKEMESMCRIDILALILLSGHSSEHTADRFLGNDSVVSVFTDEFFQHLICCEILRFERESLEWDLMNCEPVLRSKLIDIKACPRAGDLNCISLILPILDMRNQEIPNHRIRCAYNQYSHTISYQTRSSQLSFNRIILSSCSSFDGTVM